MRDKVLLLALTRVYYEDGTSVLVEMKPEMAAEIKRLDECLRKRESRRKLREKTFTEMGIDDSHIEDGNPWEGPRFRFTWLVGESRTWQGPAWVVIDGQLYCPICWGLALPSHAYCIGCDATGREMSIPLPTDDDIAKRAELKAYRPDELKGGLDGKK